MSRATSSAFSRFLLELEGHPADSRAFTDGTTYTNLLHRSSLASHWLPPSRIAVCSLNTPNLVITVLACCMAGGVPVVINHAMPPNDVVSAVLSCMVLVVDSALKSIGRAAVGRRPGLAVVEMEGICGGVGGGARPARAGVAEVVAEVMTASALGKALVQPPPPPPTATATATQDAKPATSSSSSFVNMRLMWSDVVRTRLAVPLSSAPRWLCCAPLFVASELFSAMVVLREGGVLSFTPRGSFSAEAVLSSARLSRAELFVIPNGKMMAELAAAGEEGATATVDHAQFLFLGREEVVPEALRTPLRRLFPRALFVKGFGLQTEKLPSPPPKKMSRTQSVSFDDAAASSPRSQAVLTASLGSDEDEESGERDGRAARANKAAPSAPSAMRASSSSLNPGSESARSSPRTPRPTFIRQGSGAVMLTFSLESGAELSLEQAMAERQAMEELPPSSTPSTTTTKVISATPRDINSASAPGTKTIANFIRKK
jgi:hypothetical protein